MKNYVVKLSLLLDGYEKSTTTGVMAKDEREAQYLALLGECHNDPEWDDEVYYDACRDEHMYYSVYEVTEIEDSDEFQRICRLISYLPPGYRDRMIDGIDPRRHYDV